MIEFSEATEELAERALRARRILPTPEAVRLVAIGIAAARVPGVEVAVAAGLLMGVAGVIALFVALMVGTV